MDDDPYQAGLRGDLVSPNSPGYVQNSIGNQVRLANLEAQRVEQERQRAAAAQQSADLFPGDDQPAPRPSPTTAGPSRGGGTGQSTGGDGAVGLIVLTVIGLAITAWYSVEIALIVGGLILAACAALLSVVVLVALLLAAVKLSAMLAWALAKYIASLWAWCLAFAGAFFIGAWALSVLGFYVAADSTQPTWEIAVGWGLVGLLAGCGIGMVASAARGLYRTTIRFWRSVRRRFGGAAAAEPARAESFESILPSWMLPAMRERLSKPMGKSAEGADLAALGTDTARLLERILHRRDQ